MRPRLGSPATRTLAVDGLVPPESMRIASALLYMTPPYFPPAATLAAGDAAKDDGEKGQDRVEDGLADGNDAVHNGHNTAGNGIEYRLNLESKKGNS